MKLTTCKSVQSGIVTWIILLSILLASCATAPAPVDGDVVNLYARTTMWMIDQLSRPVPPVGVEVLYNSAKQLLVISEPFQEGYGFVVLDSNTFTALEDANVAKSLCGNYVNCSTWTQFRDWLLQNGWVTQLVMFANSISQSWYTFAIGTIYIPAEVVIPGYEEYKQ